jgi:spermidine synthase
MKNLISTCCLLVGLVVSSNAAQLPGKIVFETTSPYHHIQVIDDSTGLRTLSFDGSWETQMYLTNTLAGHFEYTELFQMTWLWNSRATNILIEGLGGGSTQRLYEHYCPDVNIETVEIDPAVLDVAKKYFHFQESPRQKVHLEDGRVFLRRTQAKFDVILMDAYTSGRYGSSMPPQLVTKEFFELAASHLSTNGVLAYNVIGQLRGYREDVMGALYKTMNSVFPQVYIFPAQTSQNAVLIATKAPQRDNSATLQRRANVLLTEGRVKLPTFRRRLGAFWTSPPPTASTAPVLTDDYEPLERLLHSGG